MIINASWSDQMWLDWQETSVQSVSNFVQKLQKQKSVRLI